MNINQHNIDEAIKSIREVFNIKTQPTAGRFFVVPPIMYTDKIDRRKYKGKGRPRKTDYESFSPACEISKWMDEASNKTINPTEISAAQ